MLRLLLTMANRWNYEYIDVQGRTQQLGLPGFRFPWIVSAPIEPQVAQPSTHRLHDAILAVALARMMEQMKGRR